MRQCIELIDWRGHVNEENVVCRIHGQDDIAEFLAENQNRFASASVSQCIIPSGYLGEIFYLGQKYLFWDCEVICADQQTTFKLYLKEYSFASRP